MKEVLTELSTKFGSLKMENSEEISIIFKKEDMMETQIIITDKIDKKKIILQWEN